MDREAVVEVARVGLRATSSWLPLPIGTEANEHVLWAGGYVARCPLRLLSAMTTLVENQEDEAPAHERTCALVGAYVPERAQPAGDLLEHRRRTFGITVGPHGWTGPVHGPTRPGASRVVGDSPPG